METRLSERALLRKPPVLRGESVDEFKAFYEALKTELQPRGPIEGMYMQDISANLWESSRLWRCKTDIVNLAYPAALESLLRQLLKPAGQSDYVAKEEAERLALAWFTDQEAKIRVAELLHKFGLEESAIEAEALRTCSDDLERIDRLLASLEFRRDKSLRFLREYREGFARRLEESAAKIIEARAIPKLEHSSTNQPTAA